MRIFCEYIKDSIWEKFNYKVDVSISPKKKLVHFAFKRPYLLIHWHKEILLHVKKQWKKREMFFFSEYEMIFPKLITSLCWRYDYVFFQKKKKE